MTSKKVPFQNIKIYNHVTSFGTGFDDSETSKYLSNIYHVQYFKAMLKGFLIRLEKLVSKCKDLEKVPINKIYTIYTETPCDSQDSTETIPHLPGIQNPPHTINHLEERREESRKIIFCIGVNKSSTMRKHHTLFHQTITWFRNKYIFNTGYNTLLK